MALGLGTPFTNIVVITAISTIASISGPGAGVSSGPMGFGSVIIITTTITITITITNNFG